MFPCGLLRPLRNSGDVRGIISANIMSLRDKTTLTIAALTFDRLTRNTFNTMAKRNGNTTVSLTAAKKAKNDEFYTQLTDIERELTHYQKHFKGQVVYCNCDDPHVSNFFHYFSYNFENLGLSKLITTCYKNKKIDLLRRNDSECTGYLEYTGKKKRGNVPNPNDIGFKHLKGDGDFRSEECIELLKQADIVVTNPPFSLFREYVAQLDDYKKCFLIIGNVNAITYKETFRIIHENRMWLGVSISSGDREFEVPDDYPLTATTHRIDENGKKYVRVKGVRWFTNLDHSKRHEDLILYKKYTPKEYPKYDNYDAINVDKTNDIPIDYDGVMGVPITFLDKYNPVQFEILGKTNNKDSGQGYLIGDNPTAMISGKSLYHRILIRRKKSEPQS